MFIITFFSSIFFCITLFFIPFFRLQHSLKVCSIIFNQDTLKTIILMNHVFLATPASSSSSGMRRTVLLLLCRDTSDPQPSPLS